MSIFLNDIFIGRQKHLYGADNNQPDDYIIDHVLPLPGAEVVVKHPCEFFFYTLKTNSEKLIIYFLASIIRIILDDKD